MPPAKKQEGPISLKRLVRSSVTVKIEGVTPLLMHKWSDRNKQKIIDKQMGVSREKVARDPEQEYLDTIYRLTDGSVGFPAIAFKLATVSAARLYDNVTMTSLKPTIYVVADDKKTGLIRLDSSITSEPTIREDTVRLNGPNGSGDLRYRAEFLNWGATLTVQFYPNLITAESLVALIEGGGIYGVGDWRPEKDGEHGVYQVVAS